MNLSGLQLQPIKIANLDLNVLRVAPTVFQQTLQAPNVLQLNLQDLPARIQARDAEINRSVDLVRNLQGAADLRADVARAALALPRGLTVPSTVTLRTGEVKPVLLYGQDTVALSVAQAEASAAANRAAILKSFGLSEQNPVPREFLAPESVRAVNIAPNVRITVPVVDLVKAAPPSPPSPRTNWAAAS
ncbi:hypothetical protein [Deinococcus multiflagellatus]|uniref:Uncharacterized protein n=1 Tax=Deinococcus multiflagellatus TaxID=1656887 RepID=A0ABW1ZJP0_9DEIO